jgi:DNA-binding transcriptional regulator YhcF (GntR family)
MTPRLSEYHKFLRAFFEDNDQFPPVYLLAEAMGVNPNAAHCALLRLEAQNIIQRNSIGKWMWYR